MKQAANGAVWAPFTAELQTTMLNDAGTELAMRNAYKASAEASCKKSHKVAASVTGIGRKPYTNCVNGKMSDYDATVGAELAAKKEAAEEARLAKLKAEDAAVTQTLLSAETENETAKASTVLASSAAKSNETTAIFVGAGGVILLFALLFFLYQKTLPAAPVA